MQLERHEAVEILRPTDGALSRSLFISCEHASNRVPLPWAWLEEDRWLLDTHWAYDPGAAGLARELGEACRATTVQTRFTRLLADANRPIDHPDLIRTKADGREIAINRDVGEDERRRRIDQLWRPYHQALDQELLACDARTILAVHSFTPVYEGNQREVEIGVLFDTDEDMADRLADNLRERGVDGRTYDVRLNEPYSGKDGLVFSAESHARTHGLQCVELEIRQDLIDERAVRDHIVNAVRRALTE